MIKELPGIKHKTIFHRLFAKWLVEVVIDYEDLPYYFYSFMSKKNAVKFIQTYIDKRDKENKKAVLFLYNFKVPIHMIKNPDKAEISYYSNYEFSKGYKRRLKESLASAGFKEKKLDA